MGIIERIKKIFSKEKTAPSVQEKTVHDLSIGDIVSYYDQDFTVESVLRFNEDGFEWKEYRLTDGDETKWLTAEEDDGLALSWMHEVKIDIPEDISKQITHDDKIYKLDEHGNASAVITEASGKRNRFECEYWDFESDDDELLSIERWGGKFEVSTGKSIKEHELTIYPASLAS